MHSMRATHTLWRLTSYVMLGFNTTQVTMCKHTATRIRIWWGCPAGGRLPHGKCFLALGFALQTVYYSLQSRQHAPTVPAPTPETLMDIPCVKPGQQLYNQVTFITVMQGCKFPHNTVGSIYHVPFPAGIKNSREWQAYYYFSITDTCTLKNIKSAILIIPVIIKV